MYILIILGISRFVSRRGVNDATSSVPLRGEHRIKFYVRKLVVTYIIVSSDRRGDPTCTRTHRRRRVEDFTVYARDSADCNSGETHGGTETMGHFSVVYI